MLFNFYTKKLLNRYGKIVAEIDKLEDQYAEYSDIKLSLALSKLKNSLNDKDKKKRKTIDQVIPDTFAIVREAIKRKLGMRAYPVQLIGGLVLQEGKLAEMKTGEGKTIVIPFAAVLNSLTGKGVHIVTVNEYLAKRDSEFLRPVYEALGLTVGATLSEQSSDEKKAAYACDITYGVNHEFGFDYLRDNLVTRPEQRVQRSLNFAIVDEVDSILIDEARTPLIISGTAASDAEAYKWATAAVKTLVPDDYILEEKLRQVNLTEQGYERIEQFFIDHKVIASGKHLYDGPYLILTKAVNAALQANLLFHKNKQYLVENGEIVIVDENTGRKMEGRRWSEGLHQAMEAKEGLPIKDESQTLATISYQNLFRMYNKLAGLTGTAATEREEFEQVYGLEVVSIPTNKPVCRLDHPDVVFKSRAAKYVAVVAEIKERHAKGQPVLVGTASVHTSEEVSVYLQKANIPHNLLNAQNHFKEAEIIAEAGTLGAVTVATNMAGRGTDILLGGNLTLELQQLKDKLGVEEDALIYQEEAKKLTETWKLNHAKVIELGGLAVIGTERHESRRVDNQLRGRAGRQGDIGESRFYLSFEDDLLRIFGNNLDKMARVIGLGDSDALEHNSLTKAITKAQIAVEQRNYEVRKNLLKFDNVISEQRMAVYNWRNDIVNNVDTREYLEMFVTAEFDRILDLYIFEKHLPETWDIAGLEQHLVAELQVTLPLQAWVDDDTISQDSQTFKQHARNALLDVLRTREAVLVDGYERDLLLAAVDPLWRYHLTEIESLRNGIHLRSYAQKDPIQEFKREAFSLFLGFKSALGSEITSVIFAPPVQFNPDSLNLTDTAQPTPPMPEQKPPAHKLKRIARCWCGSGKRYKHCHGNLKISYTI